MTEVVTAYSLGTLNILLAFGGLLTDQTDGLHVSIGLSLWVLGVALVATARASNPHFVPELVRPPHLITSGIYRWLRHPGYLGFVVNSCGVFIAGGCLTWAAPVLIAYLLIIWRRVRAENKLLYGDSE